jgi:hypothetical protein
MMPEAAGTTPDLDDFAGSHNPGFRRCQLLERRDRALCSPILEETERDGQNNDRQYGACLNKLVNCHGDCGGHQ